MSFPDNGLTQYLYFLWIEYVSLMNGWFKLYEDWIDLWFYKKSEE